MNNMGLAVVPVIGSMVIAQTIDPVGITPQTPVSLGVMIAGIAFAVGVVAKVFAEKRKEDCRRIKYESEREAFEARTKADIDRLDAALDKKVDSEKVG